MICNKLLHALHNGQQAFALQFALQSCLHLKVRIVGMPKGTMDSMADMLGGIWSLFKVRCLNDHSCSVRHDMLHEDGQDLSCQLLLRLQAFGQKHCEPGKLAESQHDTVTWEVGHMAASAKWEQAALGDRGEINVPDQNKPRHAAVRCCLAWQSCMLLPLLLTFPEMEDSIPNGTAFQSTLQWHALKVIRLQLKAVARKGGNCFTPVKTLSVALQQVSPGLCHSLQGTSGFSPERPDDC